MTDKQGIGKIIATTGARENCRRQQISKHKARDSLAIGQVILHFPSSSLPFREEKCDREIDQRVRTKCAFGRR